MQITDPIADMLTRIRNAGNARHASVDVPASKMKKAIAQILLDEGYIKSFEVVEGNTQGIIRIALKYVDNRQKAITGIKRVSKPGLRVYAGAQELPKVLRGLGIAIVSTSRGVMTDKKARELNVGGEVLPIAIPAGVEVKIDGSVVTVKGAKATLTREFHPNMTIAVEGNEILVTRPNDDKHNRALHGLTRSLVHNMVVGVTDGFKKELSVQGVGYRVAKQGKDLVMNLGYSHQVTMSEVEGITIDVPNPNTIIISGPDKQKVGQFAAEVREKRPPEPYKGKGIRYADEYVRRKEGKTGAKKK